MLISLFLSKCSENDPNRGFCGTKLILGAKSAVQIYHKEKRVKKYHKILLGAEVEAFSGFAKSFLQWVFVV